MDPDRAPESIREFIAAIVCPICEMPKAKGVMVQVFFQQPNLYQVRARCLRCNQVYGWNFSGLPPTSAFQPPDPAPKEVPLPRWVLDVMPPFAPQEPGPIATPGQEDLDAPDVPDDEQPGEDHQPAAPEVDRNGGSQEGA